MGFTGIDWVWLGFTGFYWVLLGFTGFYWVWLGLTGRYWVWLGLTGFYGVFIGVTGFDWVFSGSNGSYWVLNGFYRVLLAFPVIYGRRVLNGCAATFLFAADVDGRSTRAEFSPASRRGGWLKVKLGYRVGPRRVATNSRPRLAARWNRVACASLLEKAMQKRKQQNATEIRKCGRRRRRRLPRRLDCRYRLENFWKKIKFNENSVSRNRLALVELGETLNNLIAFRDTP